MSAKPFSKVSFVKSYLLPVLITFLIPGFALWFFNHVESSLDQGFRAAALSQIQVEKEITPEQRQRATEFYGRTLASRILASHNPEMKDMQKSFTQQTRDDYATFRWMKRLSLFCLVVGAVAFVAAGIGVLCSFRSQNALYWSLRVSWVVLRWFAVIEVLGQGVLLVALSFWMTAFWAQRYYVKLIVIAGVMAALGAWMLIAAILRRLHIINEFRGQLLEKDAAPELWERISQMAEKLGITPPDHVFIGIDDNFFVTEHPVKVDGKDYQGRTLYASLSLLKTLTRGEADAVLAHELAHFSGEDTVYSRRITPLLGKYGHYLEALQKGMTYPIFLFMLFFWNLYQLAISKLSREREFRADGVGAELTSPEDIANALIKISAYSGYRRKVQTTLFEKDENVEAMDVSTRIENGFPTYLVARAEGSELAETHTPHPFDSHPPLEDRIQRVGLDPGATLKVPPAVPAVEDSWFAAIKGAAELEAAQWKEFEDQFHQAHQEHLAWRFKPEGEVEIAHVEKYFPALEFADRKGKVTTISYEGLQGPDWKWPVPFAAVVKCEIKDQLGRKQLVITFKEGEKKRIQWVNHLALKLAGHDFIQSFQTYYSRHLTSKEYLSQKVAAEPAKELAKGEEPAAA